MYNMWGERMPLHYSWGSDSWGGPCPSSSQVVSGSRPVTVSLNCCVRSWWKSWVCLNGQRGWHHSEGQVPEAVLSAWLTAHKALHRQRFLERLHTQRNLGWDMLGKTVVVLSLTLQSSGKVYLAGWAHLFIFGSVGGISDDTCCFPYCCPAGGAYRLCLSGLHPFLKHATPGFSRRWKLMVC